MTVLIHRLFGGTRETADMFKVAQGKTIAAVRLEPDFQYGGALRLDFDDGTAIRLYDEGQTCCETRYMTTDADLAAFVGATLTDAEVRDGPETVEGAVDHETAFLA